MGLNKTNFDGLSVALVLHKDMSSLKFETVICFSESSDGDLKVDTK